MLWQEQIDERPFPYAQYYFVIIPNASVILTIFNNIFALEDYGSGFQGFLESNSGNWRFSSF